jgi:hypothetical protein
MTEATYLVKRTASFTAESRKESASARSTMFASTVGHTLSGMAVNASSGYVLRLKLPALIDRDLR